MAGEWSLAINDCGQYLNGVNLGTRYEGDFVEAGREFPRQGSCDRFGDVANWDSALRAQYLEFALAEMDVMQNFFFVSLSFSKQLSFHSHCCFRSGHGRLARTATALFLTQPGPILLVFKKALFLGTLEQPMVPA